MALTLRASAGSRPEIARAFLVPEATLAKRLVRGRAKIKAAGIPYRVPPGDELPARLGAVLAVVYLVFNEGYFASAGDALLRADLCDEAIRLGRMIVELMPVEPEARGLLALMLLHHARRETRIDGDGDDGPPRRAGPLPLGPRGDRGGEGAGGRRRSAGGDPGSTRSRPRSPPSTPRRRPRPTPTGPRLPHCTGSSRVFARRRRSWR